MNIYISNVKDDRILGIARAIEKKHQSTFFLDKGKSVFDLIEESSPDLIIFHEAHIDNKDLVKYIKHAKPELKVVVLTSSNQINTEMADLVVDLNTMEYCANDIDFCGGEYADKYKSDITAFIDEQITNRDIKFLSGLAYDFNIKIYGSQKIHLVYYLGTPNLADYRNIIASTKIILSPDKKWEQNAFMNRKHFVSLNGFRSFENLNNECHFNLTKEPTVKDFKTYSQYVTEIFGDLV